MMGPRLLGLLGLRLLLDLLPQPDRRVTQPQLVSSSTLLQGVAVALSAVIPMCAQPVQALVMSMRIVLMWIVRMTRPAVNEIFRVTHQLRLAFWGQLLRILPIVTPLTTRLPTASRPFVRVAILLMTSRMGSPLSNRIFVWRVATQFPMATVRL